MDELIDFLAGEPKFLDFSQNTLLIVLLCSIIAGGSGILSRRVLFPKLMDIIAKTERIDGRDLFAPKSLGWMIGCLIMSMSLNWISANGEPVWNDEWMNIISDISVSYTHLTLPTT